MPVPSESIEQLLARLRAGEEEAARQLVRLYEPFIRRAIRPQIARFNLRAAVDSADICQSVLGGFLRRFAQGRFQLENQDDLERLLLGMMRRKFAHVVRREYAERRDRNRMTSLEHDDDRPTDIGGGPEELAMRRDLVEKVLSRLDEVARQLFRWRLEGRSWSEIAELTGVSGALNRQRLSRALRAVTRDLE